MHSIRVANVSTKNLRIFCFTEKNRVCLGFFLVVHISLFCSKAVDYQSKFTLKFGDHLEEGIKPADSC